MNKKYQNLLKELQNTLDDPKVKINQELTNVLISYKYKLEDAEESTFAVVSTVVSAIILLLPLGLSDINSYPHPY